MRILTCLHTMEIGGSQINAIEIGARVAGLGHEVIVHGPEGALCAMVGELGLEFVAAPRKGAPPSPRNVAAIADVVRSRKVDLVHAYEWAPSLEAAYGAHLRAGVPLVTTVLSMEVPAWVPRHLPLIVGTEELAVQQRRRRSEVHLIEPPIDTDANSPAGADRRGARAALGLADDELVIVSVSRLSAALKLEGLLAAVRAVGSLDPALRSRFLVVGDGPARAAVQSAADEVNAAAGAERVTLVGELLDPRPAYAAADIVVGMGMSALRAMAFARPLVVQGERGFWLTLRPETLPVFLHQGFYGLGDGTDGSARAAAALIELAQSRALRAELGAFGRSVVVDRFSLDAAARRQLKIYESAVGGRWSPARRAGALAHPTAHLINFKRSLATQRLRDFRRRTESGS